MITRIVADLIDVWLALATWRHRAADLWLALPGDVIGLTVMRLCGGLRPTREVLRPTAPGDLSTCWTPAISRERAPPPAERPKPHPVTDNPGAVGGHRAARVPDRRQRLQQTR